VVATLGRYMWLLHVVATRSHLVATCSSVVQAAHFVDKCSSVVLVAHLECAEVALQVLYMDVVHGCCACCTWNVPRLQVFYMKPACINTYTRDLNTCKERCLSVIDERMWECGT